MWQLSVISHERLKIKVKLLLSANRKSYMPRRLAQQRMTLSDLEWLFHSSSAPSVWERRERRQCAVLIVHTKISIIRIARYLCGS